MIERVTRRVRHELKLRLAEVQEVVLLTPRMRRIILGGPELTGFVSAAHDDHIKLFLPAPGQDRPVLPILGPNGPVFAEGTERPVARDYTPRRFDARTNRLTIDMALHGDGPAAEWAAQARAGQMVGIGGPRGSFIVPDGFDWFLLAGDETALPAIGRRLEELPAGARAIVIIEVADDAEEQPFASRATLDITWLHRNRGGHLEDALAALVLPPGEGYAWVAAESAVAKAARRILVEDKGHAKDRIKAAGYWRRGAIAVHDHHE